MTRDGTPGASNTLLARRALALIAVAISLVFLISAAFLIKIAFTQNHQALEQTRFYAEKALSGKVDSQLRSLSDYAFWGDAYQHLHIEVDTDWAYTRRNLGSSLYEDFGYEGVFVVDGHNRTSYGVIRSRISKVSAKDWVKGDLEDLVAKAREPDSASQAVVGAFTVSGDPALITAAALTTGGDPQISEISGVPSVLLFVDVLDAAELEQLGKEFGLPNLRKAEAASDIDHPHVSLVPGSAVNLRWDAPRPGDQLMIFLLPSLGLAAFIVLGVGWVLAIKHLAAARLLDESYQSLQVSEARFHDIAEASSDWLWEADANRCFSYLSNRFETVTGYPVDSWLGRPLDELLKFDVGVFDGLGSDSAVGQRGVPLNCTYQSETGKFCTCRLMIRVVLLPDGMLEYRGTATDTTAQAENQLRIQHLQNFDALTGLPNRGQLVEALEARLHLVDKFNELVLLTISLTGLKQLNDKLGRAGGDELLVLFAQRLERFFRSDDLIFRYTSDEFAAVLNISNGGVADLCRRLIDYVGRPFPKGPEEFTLGVRIGVAIAPHDANTAQELIRCAEIALYEARGLAATDWCLFNREQEFRIFAERKLEYELRSSIANNELRLHFQPRYNTLGMGMVGAEALVRWQHPERGLLGPQEFIGLAERTGLIGDLGSWVLKSACEQALAFGSSIFVSVNLSVAQFRHVGLVDQIRNVLDEVGLPANRLELEITESMMLDDAQDALEKLQDLKGLGVRLSMDDFGTGYSSLSYLGRYPFDTLKIDRSFIAELMHQKLAVVRAIVQLGRALSMKITAEGVESEEQLILLRDLGCDEVQGYHLARPMPADDLHRLLEP